MSSDKSRLILMAILSITLFIGIALYGFTMITEKEVNLGNGISVLITLLVVFFMTFFIMRRYKDIKQGMPLEDERSKKVVTQAAAQSFYISLYWLLLISFFESFFAKTLFGLQQLDAGQTVGGAIAGMAITFFICWFYYDKRGKLV